MKTPRLYLAAEACSPEERCLQYKKFPLEDSLRLISCPLMKVHQNYFQEKAPTILLKIFTFVTIALKNGLLY